jgi:hypothetical protein
VVRKAEPPGFWETEGVGFSLGLVCLCFGVHWRVCIAKNWAFFVETIGSFYTVAEEDV